MAAAPPGEPVSRELLVLRHAKASRDAAVASDFDRPLTGRGRRDAPRMGRWIKARDLVPDHVLSSPARRARETAELVADELGLAGAVRWDERVYDADVPDLLRALADVPPDARRVLLVGHNPGLEDLVRRVGGTTVRDAPDGKFFPTCALAHLRVDSAWRELRAGTVLAIVSWSRKEHRWRIRGA